MVDELFQNEDQILNDSNVRRDEFFHARPKNLHDDVLATVSSPVHLPERSCRERFHFKRVEHPIEWPLQLSLDSFSDFSGWKWRDPIVQIPELFDVKLRNYVRANPKDLCKLNEAGAERCNSLSQSSRPLAMGFFGYESWRTCKNPAAPVA